MSYVDHFHADKQYVLLKEFQFISKGCKLFYILIFEIFEQ